MLVGEDKFGARLKKLRDTRELTLEDAWSRTGIHKSSWSMIENGLRTPSMATIMKIDRGLDLSKTELIYLFRGPSKTRNKRKVDT